ncbi:transmembrane protein, putative [Medicago truncatula]|uniref:Transmembrane protein, putative n=1 Tax=Medicago truncatula TaxID=3880 RepID=G7LA66_MEDTR|nr:transmembrane protein, putative [Medicago truncatula]
MAFDIVKHTTSALESLRTDVDWLGILDDDSLFAMAGLKWCTFTVEFNPKQAIIIIFLSVMIFMRFFNSQSD